MLNKNQKGIGTVAAIIVMALIGVVAFAGWRVWQSQAGGQTNENVSRSEADGKPNSSGEPADQYELPEEFVAVHNSEQKLYTDFGYTVMLPDNWHMGKYGEATNYHPVKDTDELAGSELHEGKPSFIKITFTRIWKDVNLENYIRAMDGFDGADIVKKFTSEFSGFKCEVVVSKSAAGTGHLTNVYYKTPEGFLIASIDDQHEINQKNGEISKEAKKVLNSIKLK